MSKRMVVLLISASAVASLLAWAVQLIALDSWVWPPVVGTFLIMLGVFDLVRVPKVVQVFAAVGLLAGVLIRGVAV
jgi:hypothetical protein